MLTDCEGTAMSTLPETGLVCLRICLQRWAWQQWGNAGPRSYTCETQAQENIPPWYLHTQPTASPLYPACSTASGLHSSNLFSWNPRCSFYFQISCTSTWRMVVTKIKRKLFIGAWSYPGCQIYARRNWSPSPERTGRNRPSCPLLLMLPVSMPGMQGYRYMKTFKPAVPCSSVSNSFD